MFSAAFANFITDTIDRIHALEVLGDEESRRELVHAQRVLMRAIDYALLKSNSDERMTQLYSELVTADGNNFLEKQMQDLGIQDRQKAPVNWAEVLCQDYHFVEANLEKLKNYVSSDVELDDVLEEAEKTNVYAAEYDEGSYYMEHELLSRKVNIFSNDDISPDEKSSIAEALDLAAPHLISDTKVMSAKRYTEEGKKIEDAWYDTQKAELFTAIASENELNGAARFIADHDGRPEAEPTAEMIDWLKEHKLTPSQGHMDNIRALVGKMNDLGLAPDGNVRGEEGGKVYGFSKYVEARGALEAAVKGGNAEEITKATERLAAVENAIDEMYEMIGETLGTEESGFPGNVDSFRSENVPPKYKKNYKINAVFNGLYLLSGFTRANGIELDEYIQDPEKYTTAFIKSAYPVDWIDDQTRGKSIAELCILSQNASFDGAVGNSKSYEALRPLELIYSTEPDQGTRVALHAAVLIAEARATAYKTEHSEMRSVISNLGVKDVRNFFLADGKDPDFKSLLADGYRSGDTMEKTPFDIVGYLKTNGVNPIEIERRVRENATALLRQTNSAKTLKLLIGGAQLAAIEALRFKTPDINDPAYKDVILLADNPAEYCKTFLHVEKITFDNAEHPNFADRIERSKALSRFMDEKSYNSASKAIYGRMNAIAAAIEAEQSDEAVNKLQSDMNDEINKLSRLQREEFNRLSGAYRNGELPQSYFVRRMKNIMENEPEKQPTQSELVIEAAERSALLSNYVFGTPDRHTALPEEWLEQIRFTTIDLGQADLMSENERLERDAKAPTAAAKEYLDGLYGELNDIIEEKKVTERGLFEYAEIVAREQQLSLKIQAFWSAYIERISDSEYLELKSYLGIRSDSEWVKPSFVEIKMKRESLEKFVTDDEIFAEAKAISVAYTPEYLDPKVVNHYMENEIETRKKQIMNTSSDVTEEEKGQFIEALDRANELLVADYKQNSDYKFNEAKEIAVAVTRTDKRYADASLDGKLADIGSLIDRGAAGKAQIKRTAEGNAYISDFRFDIPETHKNSIKRILEAMREKGLAPEGHTEGEEAIKVYGFHKYIKAKETLEKAVKGGNLSEIQQANDALAGEEKKILDMYDIITEELTDEEKNFTDNLDNIRNPMIPLRLKENIKLNTVLNLAYLALDYIAKYNLSIDAYVDDPFAPLKNKINSYAEQFNVDRKYEGKSIGLAAAETYSFDTDFIYPEQNYLGELRGADLVNSTLPDDELRGRNLMLMHLFTEKANVAGRQTVTDRGFFRECVKSVEDMRNMFIVPDSDRSFKKLLSQKSIDGYDFSETGGFNFNEYVANNTIDVVALEERIRRSIEDYVSASGSKTYFQTLVTGAYKAAEAALLKSPETVMSVEANSLLNFLDNPINYIDTVASASERGYAFNVKNLKDGPFYGLNARIDDKCKGIKKAFTPKKWEKAYNKAASSIVKSMENMAKKIKKEPSDEKAAKMQITLAKELNKLKALQEEEVNKLNGLYIAGKIPESYLRRRTEAIINLKHADAPTEAELAEDEKGLRAMAYTVLNSGNEKVPARSLPNDLPRARFTAIDTDELERPLEEKSDIGHPTSNIRIREANETITAHDELNTADRENDIIEWNSADRENDITEPNYSNKMNDIIEQARRLFGAIGGKVESPENVGSALDLNATHLDENYAYLELQNIEPSQSLSAALEKTDEIPENVGIAMDLSKFFRAIKEEQSIGTDTPELTVAESQKSPATGDVQATELECIKE